MKKEIKNFRSEQDIAINILVFLKTRSSPNIEICNIQSNRDTSIVVEQFFHRSPDYLELVERLQKQRIVFQSLPVELVEQRLIESENLNKLEELIRMFKIDVLQLADIFLKIDLNSSRLIQARQMFEQGLFKEADAILKEEELVQDQHNLLTALDYLEQQRQTD